jgi:hypothetical protein
MKKLGPYSNETALAKLDGRTKEARHMRETRAALIEHVGGTPTATQRTLIDRAVQLSLRIALMDQRFADAGRMGEVEGRMYLAWSNALNRTVRELGIKAAPSRAPTPAELWAASKEPAA